MTSAQDAPKFAPGDLVWLERKHIHTIRPCSKLDATKLGPFPIMEAVETRAFRLKLPKSMYRIHPVFHVSLIEPDRANGIQGQVAPLPPLIQVAGDVE
jgi:hypothetical protein